MTTMPTPDLHWGYKLVGVDLATDDHNGGRFRYPLGDWVHPRPAPGCKSQPFTTRDECPAFPGDGLCVATSLSGAQSGGARLGSSAMLLVGYLPGDVLAEGRDKIRVKKLWVHPDPLDPVSIIARPGAYLRDANLRYADLGGANLRGADLGGANLRNANLGGANRPLWLPERYTVTSAGFVVEATA